MSQERRARISQKLDDINRFVDWENLVEHVRVIDKSGTKKGGRPRYPLMKMLKLLFLYHRHFRWSQHLYNLSDPELEDQLLDRLSFRSFVGITSDTEVPDFTTVWVFKEKLVEHGLMDSLFDSIVTQLESRHLVLRKGTIVDASIIESSNRPLSKKKRAELEEKRQEDETSVTQIDLDAHATAKGGKKYFGYKGHTRVPVSQGTFAGHFIAVYTGSKLIRRRAFTPANMHDSQVTLFCGDERSLFGDKAYSNNQDKRDCRARGIFYGVLGPSAARTPRNKATRRRSLSNKQKGRNSCLSRVRSAVEHPFAYMADKLGYGEAVAKTQARNSLRFDLNCMLHNVMRGIYLLKEQKRWA
jgi:IS5 family transposase